MRLALLLAALLVTPCFADGGYRGVAFASAQADAQEMARTGVLRHLGRNGGKREGIGFSTAGADAACRACCYYGRYRVADLGVAYSAVRRGWFACIRYE